MKLAIIGGTYLECCDDPRETVLFGSGLRAVAALANFSADLEFISCIDDEYKLSAESACETFGAKYSFTQIPEIVAFQYYHPLSIPLAISSSLEGPVTHLQEVNAQNVMYYGMIEATAKVNAEYLVYDPQNHISYKETGSHAQHLALVLNKKESLELSRMPFNTSLEEVGKYLLHDQNAEVIVIKNGSHGALVIDSLGVYQIPVFKTEVVWPIGSGDIFSATFAWKWMIEKAPPEEAALFASKCTAQYCSTRYVPLPLTPAEFEPIIAAKKRKRIYLAAPFFTTSERWLVHELHQILEEFESDVFSPYHDVGVINENNFIDEAAKIATKDLEGLKECDVVLAVVNQIDAGTLFEIGYATSFGKQVVIFSENIHPNDLTMLVGTNCQIVNDLSTAVYSVSW